MTGHTANLLGALALAVTDRTADEIFDITRRGFDFFAEEFAYPYQFGKYEQAFVPEFNAGAMENAGLVTFAERHIFRSRVTDGTREARAETILHEMAHMWFGDLVTMRWWDDLWLNESFATYMSLVALVRATRFTSAFTTFSAGWKTWAYRQDQLPSTHPIVADMPDIESVKVNFDGITYAKGASVLRQLVALGVRTGCDVTLERDRKRAVRKMVRRRSAPEHTAFASPRFGCELGNEAVTLQLEPAKGGERESLAADVVLVAIGRRPFTNGLGLEQVGVTRDPAGRITVDDGFATNVPGIYAIGDVIRGPMLAHKAEEEGIAVVERLAGQKTEVDYDAIPSVVYTWPEAAAVGKTEEELKAASIEYRVGKFPFRANGRAVANEELDGMVKFVADAKTDRILGAHILQHAASELIAEAVSVIEFGGSSEDLARTCHSHPTLSEAVKEAAMNVEKRALHILNR